MARLSVLLKLCMLTPGRCIFALMQLRQRAAARGLDALLPDIDQAIAYNYLVLERKQARRRKKQNARPIDREIDRIIALIYSRLDSFSKDVTTPELAALTTTLLQTLFPEGVGAHVKLPYSEQAGANEQVLAELAKEQYQSLIAQLGLQPLIARLGALNTEFREVLGASIAALKPTTSLREDTSRGHDLYLQIIAKIVGQFSGEADADARADLLGPVLSQDAEIRAHRRRRRRIVDVDPTTGEPAEDEPVEGDDIDASGDLPDEPYELEEDDVEAPRAAKAVKSAKSAKAAKALNAAKAQ